MRWWAWAAFAAICAAGCAADDNDDFEYPLDDVLRLNHVQGKGTHNSYHIAPDPFLISEWNYSHLPLDQQLGEQGVRQFELDININIFDERFEVFHIINADAATTCPLLVDCLEDMKRWSDANPAHHPFVVMVENKDGYDPGFAERYFEIFEEELLSVWPEDRLITPDFVRGDYATLAEALATEGWPLLGDVRGRALFFFLDRGEHRSFYTYGDTSLDGRLAFVVADLGTPYAAVINIDNPINGAADIDAAAAAGMLIRTRVDTEDDNGPLLDPVRLEAALAGSAHFLSTDEPSEVLEPSGSPSWCNPMTAPAECEPAALEDPAFVD
jgi:hypothetical protein